MYRDEDNEVFATIVSNSDLVQMGINTNGSSYRVVS